MHQEGVLDLDVDPNYVAKLEAGKHRWPRNPERRRAFRVVLDAPTDADLGFYPNRQSRVDAEVDVAEHLVAHVGLDSAALQPSNNDPTLWLHALDGLVTTAISRGPRGLYPVIVNQIHSIDQANSVGTVSPTQIALMDARWSEFLSWVCDNDGVDDGGRWLGRAYTSAVAAGDSYLTAYVLMRQSQRAADNRDVPSAVALSRQALAGVALPARTRALCLTRLAEGLALAGDKHSLDLVTAAHQHATSAISHPVDGIARHCDARYVTAAEARCRYLLGDHRAASRILVAVLDATDDLVSPADLAIWSAYLADAQFSTNPGLAADTATDALRLANRCGSARTLRALVPLAVGLRQHQGTPEIDYFLNAHGEALVGTMPG